MFPVCFLVSQSVCVLSVLVCSDLRLKSKGFGKNFLCCFKCAHIQVKGFCFSWKCIILNTKWINTYSKQVSQKTMPFPASPKKLNQKSALAFFPLLQTQSMTKNDTGEMKMRHFDLSATSSVVILSLGRDTSFRQLVARFSCL